MEVIATGGLWLGVLVGFLAGIGFQSARQAVKAHRTAKEGLPKLKKDASSAETRGAVWLLAIGVYALLILVFVVRATAE